MENKRKELDEFIELAWQRTLVCFGADAIGHEKEFKMFFLEEIIKEYEKQKMILKMVEEGQFTDEDFSSKERKEQFIKAYENLDEIPIAFGSAAQITTTNLANALIKSGISEDGNIPKDVKYSYGTVEEIRLPKDFEFDFNFDDLVKTK